MKNEIPWENILLDDESSYEQVNHNIDMLLSDPDTLLYYFNRRKKLIALIYKDDFTGSIFSITGEGIIFLAEFDILNDIKNQMNLYKDNIDSVYTENDENHEERIKIIDNLSNNLNLYLKNVTEYFHENYYSDIYSILMKYEWLKRITIYIN